MSDETIREVIAKVEEMVEEGEEFEDSVLQDFAITIDHLLKQLSRKEEVLAMASAMLALDEYKKSLNKLVEYARVGDLKEREATLLEVLDQLDKELDMAVTMKIHEHTYRDNIAAEIKRAILDHLEPTLGRGKWHAREEATIMEIISKVMEGYLVVRVEPEV
jgi:proline dehydrogenase